MPTDLPAVIRRKPWLGQTAAHFLAMMAAVAIIALAKWMVDFAKRLDAEL